MTLKTGDEDLKQLAEGFCIRRPSTFSWFGIKRYRTSPMVTSASSSMLCPDSVGRFNDIGGASFRIVLCCRQASHEEGIIAKKKRGTQLQIT